jgi:lysyl-tRNA synthetase class 1
MKEENRKGWSPFFPKCEHCGRINTTRVTAYNIAEKTIDYVCDVDLGNVSGCNHAGVSSVLDGAVKMGWKIDWALRWYAYGVDYEMYGKDLIPSAELSAKIVRLMGGRPPQGLFYELFLDENGEKISKSIGNGVSIEEWLEYAPIDSLAHFIFREPRQAKKLFFKMIPKTMDEYLDHLRRYPTVSDEKKPDTPLWHIHNRGKSVPSYNSSINFTTVNNLVSALGQPTRELLKSYLERYDEKSAQYPEVIDTLIEKGLKYYQDQILPNKAYRPPTEAEIPLFKKLFDTLKSKGTKEKSEKELQGLVFDIARDANVEPKDFFSAIYQVLLGQPQGPRFGTFAKLVGIDRVLSLIKEYVVE